MKKIELSKELLTELYVNKKLTTYQISDELGISRQTVCNYLKEYGIFVRDSRFKATKKTLSKLPSYKNKKVFIQLYGKLGTVQKVAEYFGISIDTVYKWRVIHGINNIPDKAKYNRTTENKKWMDKNLLAEMYETYSSYEIAKLWDCNPSTVQKWLKRHGIASKSHEEQWKRSPKTVDAIVINGIIQMDRYYELCMESELPSSVALAIRNIIGECQACGFDEVLDLHHINEDRQDNRPTNHIILCPNCHAKIHRLGKTVQELCPEYKSWEELLSYAEAK
jgi:transposase/uncharacterized protein YlaI